MSNWEIVGATLIPNLGGWASSMTMCGQVKRPDNKAWFQTINKPKWNPPNWVFGPTWTVLYSGMGYASYLVYRDCDGFTERALLPLTLYGGQLLLNWAWTPVFFRQHKLGLALANILALDVAAVACTCSFYEINTHAGYLMLPYLAWLSFATLLNYNIWRLNSSPKIKEIKDEKTK